MKRLLFLSVFLFANVYAIAQFKVSPARSWNRFPPEVQKSGFGMTTSQVLQMDDTKEEEEVFLFTADNGHYPYFDIFKSYYVIIGYYSKEVKHISEITLSTSKELVLEDRNKDGIYELYRRYMKDGKFTVDENGDKLQANWVFDKVEWQSPKKNKQ